MPARQGPCDHDSDDDPRDDQPYADNCRSIQHLLEHHRADDGPAYLTILIVGHLMAPIIAWAFVTFRPDPMILASVFIFVLLPKQVRGRAIDGTAQVALIKRWRQKVGERIPRRDGVWFQRESPSWRARLT